MKLHTQTILPAQTHQIDLSDCQDDFAHDEQHDFLESLAEAEAVQQLRGRKRRPGKRTRYNSEFMD